MWSGVRGAAVAVRSADEAPGSLSGTSDVALRVDHAWRR